MAELVWEGTSASKLHTPLSSPHKCLTLPYQRLTVPLLLHKSTERLLFINHSLLLATIPSCQEQDPWLRTSWSSPAGEVLSLPRDNGECLHSIKSWDGRQHLVLRVWSQGNRIKLDKRNPCNENSLTGCNMLRMVEDGADIFKRCRSLKERRWSSLNGIKMTICGGRWPRKKLKPQRRGQTRKDTSCEARNIHLTMTHRKSKRKVYLWGVWKMLSWVILQMEQCLSKHHLWSPKSPLWLSLHSDITFRG